MYVSFMCVFCVWGSKCLSVLVCVCFVFACIEGPTVCQFCGCVLCLCALMDKSVNFVCVCFVLGPRCAQTQNTLTYILALNAHKHNTHTHDIDRHLGPQCVQAQNTHETDMRLGPTQNTHTQN